MLVAYTENCCNVVGAAVCLERLRTTRLRIGEITKRNSLLQLLSRVISLTSSP